MSRGAHVGSGVSMWVFGLGPGLKEGPHVDRIVPVRVKMEAGEVFMWVGGYQGWRLEGRIRK